MNEERRGLLLGVGAYLLWGLFPLYWPLLEPADAMEILAHRIVWSFVAVVVIIAITRQLGSLRTVLRDRRRTGMLALAGVIISGNWFVYIFGVNSGRVVETSLGYFINPLVTVLLGVLVLKEPVRRVQWVAVSIAAVAVGVLTAAYGRPPWIALVLALSFGAYGLIKKTTPVSAPEGLTIETGAVLVPALGYLVWLQATGNAAFGHHGAANTALLAFAGIATLVPLLLFAGAARRVPLVTLGLLQYLAPTLQFLIGVLVVGEQMPPSRWIGFALIWCALTIFTVDQVRHQAVRRRQLEVQAEAIG